MKPFPQSYWVIPGQFCAGQYPSGLSTSEQEAKAKALVEHGFDVIINLTDVNEVTASGKPFNDYRPLVLKHRANPEFYHYGWPDAAAPTRSQLLVVLSKLSESLEAGKKVYLHCYGGHGRSGLVIAAYLMKTRNLRVAQAIEEVCRLRNGLPKDHYPFEVCQIDFLHLFPERSYAR